MKLWLQHLINEIILVNILKVLFRIEILNYQRTQVKDEHSMSTNYPKLCF